MFKKKAIVVREHAQERAWLLNLGKGNIFEGVQNLIQEEKEKRSSKDTKKKGR